MDVTETHPAYKSGVLKEAHHARLVQNIDGFARDAGIQPFWIWTPLAETVSAAEIDYVREFRKHRVEGKVQGLAYFRLTSKAEPERHMAALAGALVRNFVRARVMTLGSVLDAVAKREEVEATCLLIPNFHFAKEEGGNIASWQVQHVHDLLVQRGQSGLQTVVYVSDFDSLRHDYGFALSRLIETNYIACAL